jgi:hypothetical protein
VLNVAVDVDGISPVKCVTRFISEKCIKLHSLQLNHDINNDNNDNNELKTSKSSSSPSNTNKFIDDEVICSRYSDFINISNDDRCSLLKVSIYLSIYLSNYLSNLYLSIYLSLYIYIYIFNIHYTGLLYSIRYSRCC